MMSIVLAGLFGFLSYSYTQDILHTIILIAVFHTYSIVFLIELLAKRKSKENQ